jgi:hypothetical protein
MPLDTPFPIAATCTERKERKERQEKEKEKEKQSTLGRACSARRVGKCGRWWRETDVQEG